MSKPCTVLTVTTSKRFEQRLDPGSLQRIADGLIKIVGPDVSNNLAILHTEAIGSRFLNENEVLVTIDGHIRFAKQIDLIQADQLKTKIEMEIRNSLKFTDGRPCSIRWVNGGVPIYFHEGGKLR